MMPAVILSTYQPTYTLFIWGVFRARRKAGAIAHRSGMFMFVLQQKRSGSVSVARSNPES